MTLKLRTGLAALAALGGLAAASASAQPPAVPAAPLAPAQPQVIRWPGGYMIMDGNGVIVRQDSPGRSTNVITGAGNGVGNKIVVSNSGKSGVTIVQGSKIGIGNSIIVDPDDLFIDLDELLFKPKSPVAPMPPPKAVPGDPVMPADPMAAPAPEPAAPPSYKGKDSPFWSKKVFSEALDCNLYWCPTTKLWFRYIADDDTYRPVPTQPAPPADEK